MSGHEWSYVISLIWLLAESDAIRRLVDVIAAMYESAANPVAPLSAVTVPGVPVA